MPTLKQLRAVVLLDATRSFTRTAHMMALTQSAVSVMIRELERELGAPVIERGRTLRLTREGEALRQSAARALADLDRVVDDIRKGIDLQRGRVRIAVAHLSAATYFPQALALFRSRFPNVTVDVVDCPVERVSQLLVAEEVDAGIGSIPADSDLATLLDADALLRDYVHAVYAARPDGRGRASPSLGRLRWTQLQGESIILVRRVQGQWRDLLLRMSQARIPVRIAYEVDLYPTAIEMARCGLGVTLLPGYAARRLDPRVFGVALMENPRTRWEVYWLQRRRAAENTGVTELRKAVAEVLAAESSKRVRAARHA